MSAENLMVQMMGRWSHIVFGEHTKKLTPKVRAIRLLEEVFELCQAEEITEQELDTVKRQVYDKPVGESYLEFRGVMTTIMAYAWSRCYDPEKAFWEEFGRIMQPEMMERVRSRNLGGDKIGIE